MKERIVFADIYLHGSFLATGKGHGTDKALIAGLLGMKPDDERIPSSLELAAERGLKYKFSSIKLRCSSQFRLMKLKGINGSRLEVRQLPWAAG